MRPYGLPRDKDIESPDLADIANYGLKAGRLHPKWTANGDSKRRTRRYWKRKARRFNKQMVDLNLHENI